MSIATVVAEKTTITVLVRYLPAFHSPKALIQPSAENRVGTTTRARRRSPAGLSLTSSGSTRPA
jgi:hypothetical protein